MGSSGSLVGAFPALGAILAPPLAEKARTLSNGDLAPHLLLLNAAVPNFKTLENALMVHGRHPVDLMLQATSSCRQRRPQRARECGAIVERDTEVGKIELLMVIPTVESIVELYRRLTGSSLSQTVIDRLTDAMLELQ